MWSKNKRQMRTHEREHVGRVKLLPCSICDMPPLSSTVNEDGEPLNEAHEIKQGQWYTAVSLCPECHRGRNGWHGTKSLWRVRKLDEVDALAITIERLMRA